MDPLKPIMDRIDEIKADVERSVEIAMLREATRFNLSRLATLDPDNAQKYTDLVAGLN